MHLLQPNKDGSTSRCVKGKEKTKYEKPPEPSHNMENI